MKYAAIQQIGNDNTTQDLTIFALEEEKKKLSQKIKAYKNRKKGLIDLFEQGYFASEDEPLKLAVTYDDTGIKRTYSHILPNGEIGAEVWTESTCIDLDFPTGDFQSNQREFDFEGNMEEPTPTVIVNMIEEGIKGLPSAEETKAANE